MARQLLQPIVHKPRYTEAIEGELRAYLWEVIFSPLFAVLAENDIEADPKDQAIGRTPQFEQFRNEAAWTLFPPECCSLGLKRKELPQIAGSDRGQLLEYVTTRGITYQEGEIKPRDLRPTQEGFWEDRLQAARDHTGAARALLCSRDWFILDGHHQWLAALIDRPEEPVPVIRFNAPIGPLLNCVRNFAGVTFKNAAPQGDPAVAAALRSGTIWYEGDRFSGEFDAVISRRLRAMGAIWDVGTKTFRLPIEKLSMELRAAVAENQEKAGAVHGTISDLLRDMSQTIPGAPTGLHYGKAVDKITEDLQKQFVRTVPALESISVPAVITPEMRAAITSELTENLGLYIKKFALEEIPELRALVEKNARSGARTGQLARIIEARYGISKRRAKFIADQETSLFVSKYRETTYKRIGVRRYMWSSSRDERVRTLHRQLDGKYFAFADPPPSGTKGEKQNPGEPYGCRCTAVPVLELPGVTVLP